MVNHKKILYPNGYYLAIITSKPIDANVMQDSDEIYYA
jgi:hypothetical protein